MQAGHGGAGTQKAAGPEALLDPACGVQIDFNRLGKERLFMARDDLGEFLEIDAPRKIVFTRKYEWEFPQLGRRETTVTYRFDPIATGTRVTVRHDGFDGLSGPADQHAEGWERVLGWLDAYMNP